MVMARYQGRLIEWHDDQGYGFIQGISDTRQQQLFLHIKNFKQQGPRPILGCVLEYDIGLDKQSRPQAINVGYVKASQVQQTQTAHAKTRSKSKLAWHPIYIVMILYWVSLFVLSAFGKLPALSLMIIMLINAYTYWIYYQDKQAAIRQGTRTSEQHLLLMGTLGGWTAAWFASQHFHHKTQKQPFKKLFFLSILINILLLTFSVWYLSIL